MSDSIKTMSDRDASQVQKFVFNDVDKSLTTNGFLVGLVGRKIVQTISTTTVLNDTITFDFQELGISLYQLQVIYTDAAYTTMLSAERIA
jgi:hypothetical protein